MKAGNIREKWATDREIIGKVSARLAPPYTGRRRRNVSKLRIVRSILYVTEFMQEPSISLTPFDVIASHVFNKVTNAYHALVAVLLYGVVASLL